MRTYTYRVLSPIPALEMLCVLGVDLVIQQTFVEHLALPSNGGGEPGRGWAMRVSVMENHRGFGAGIDPAPNLLCRPCYSWNVETPPPNPPTIWMGVSGSGQEARDNARCVLLCPHPLICYLLPLIQSLWDLVSLTGEIRTQTCTEGPPLRPHKEDSVCKPRREALGENNPPDTLTADFCIQNREKISFCCWEHSVWNFVMGVLADSYI